MKFNSILGRFLSKQILVTFLMVLLTIMGIIMMFDSIEALRRISGREDTGMDYVVKYAITKLPETIDKVLPFVMMIAAMMTFWRVSKNNEYVIIRSSGVSVWGFLKPVLITVFLVGIVNIALINPISSKMYEMHATLKYRFITRDPTAMLFSSKGLWIREAEGKAEAIRRVQKANADGIAMLKEAGADESVLTIKSLEAFEKAANGQATKIIVPSNIAGVAGLAESIKEVVSK